MANRRLIVEVVGDSRSLERTFARSTAASKKFGAETTTTLGKVEGSFTRLQRISAGGFIGGAIAASGIAAVKQLVDVSSEAQQVLGQTRVAVEATGKSWDRYGKIIQDTVEKQSRLGFDDEALLRTFSLFERNTNDVGKALELNNLAMDVARARFIDLESAAQLVNKAAIGQAGALRRLGINARTGASGLELLTLLNEKYGGSAEAASKDATTAMDRTKVSVENLQESLGSLLLPAVELLADDLDAAARSAELLVQGLKKIGSVKIPAINLPFNITIGGRSVGGLAGDVAHIAKFSPLNPLFGVTIAKAIADQFADQTSPGSAAQTQLANDFARSINTMTQNALDTAPAKAPTTRLRPPKEFAQLPGVKVDFASAILGPINKAIDVAQKAAGDAISKGQAAISKEAAQKAAEKQRESFENLLDAISLGVDRAAATRGFADDLRRNTELQNAIKRQIGVEGRTTDLTRRLFEARQARSEIIRQANAKQQADARKAAESASAAVQARQFKALGLSGTGDEIVPGIKNLSKRINQTLQNANLGKIDISSKLVSRLKAARKLIKAEGKSLTEDTRKAINDFIKAASGQDAETKTKVQDLRRITLTDKILKALGFGKDPDVARLRNLNTTGRALSAAQLGNASNVQVSPASAMTFTGPITVVADNPDAFLRELQKKAGRTSATSRGRFPGRSLGLG